MKKIFYTLFVAMLLLLPSDTFDLSDDNGIPSIEGEPVRSNHKSVWDD